MPPRCLAASTVEMPEPPQAARSVMRPPMTLTPPHLKPIRSWDEWIAQLLHYFIRKHTDNNKLPRLACSKYPGFRAESAVLLMHTWEPAATQVSRDRNCMRCGLRWASRGCPFRKWVHKVRPEAPAALVVVM